MGSKAFERFDVIIQCPCGRNLVIQVLDHPLDARWRCKVCGSTDAKVGVWPIWSRGTKGDPRGLFKAVTTEAEKAAQEELKRRFRIE